MSDGAFPSLPTGAKILVMAHELVFFGGIDGPKLEAIVRATSDACRRHGVALIGGWNVQPANADRVAFCIRCHRPYERTHGKQRYCREACRQAAYYARRRAKR